MDLFTAVRHLSHLVVRDIVAQRSLLSSTFDLPTDGGAQKFGMDFYTLHQLQVHRKRTEEDVPFLQLYTSATLKSFEST